MAQAAPLDVLSFWQLFEVAGPGSAMQQQGLDAKAAASEAEARAAVVQLQPFTLHVLPRAAKTAAGPGAPPPPLAIHFKPSGTDEPLRPDAPAIGIPSFVELGLGGNVTPAASRALHLEGGGCEGGPPPAQQQLQERRAWEPRQRQQYYFGVIRFSLARQPSPSSVLVPSAAAPSSGTGSAGRSSAEETSPLATDSPFPSELVSAVTGFYQMRPQVGFAFFRVCRRTGLSH